MCLLTRWTGVYKSFLNLLRNSKRWGWPVGHFFLEVISYELPTTVSQRRAYVSFKLMRYSVGKGNNLNLFRRYNPSTIEGTTTKNIPGPRREISSFTNEGESALSENLWTSVVVIQFRINYLFYSSELFVSYLRSFFVRV